jgi:hypothetical protein
MQSLYTCDTCGAKCRNEGYCFRHDPLKSEKHKARVYRYRETEKGYNKTYETNKRIYNKNKLIVTN